MVIGIPRSTFFHYYFPHWSGFFEALDINYLVSPPTSPAILQQGLHSALDEICLPVKIHLGHMAYLRDKVDFVFSPGYGKCGIKSHYCPKLIGLPDMVRLKLENSLEFWHDLDINGNICPAAWLEPMQTILPGLDRNNFNRAWKHGRERQDDFYRLLAKGYNAQEAINYLAGKKPLVKLETGERTNILVLGHPYLVYDTMANLGLIEVLHQNGVRVITKEMTPVAEKTRLWPAQEKTVFWQLGQEILSAALYHATVRRVDGIIFLSACLCGPDAIIGELLERYMGQVPQMTPLLKLTVDEHTGRAGMQTRVEAFMDLMSWRKQHAAV